MRKFFGAILVLVSFIQVATAMDCAKSNRKGLITRYGYPADPYKDTDSMKHKGNRANQLRKPKDGYQKTRLTGQEWVTELHLGSCAVLGKNKKDVLGISSNKLVSNNVSVNPMLKMILSNGSVRRCCWEDSGSDTTADKHLLNNPENSQIVIDLFDPKSEHTGSDGLSVCKVEIVGDCMNESHKGISPKVKAASSPDSVMVIPVKIIDVINQGAIAPDPLFCEEVDLI